MLPLDGNRPLIEILLSLLFVLAFVTLFGHGSWLLIAAVMRMIRGEQTDTATRAFQSSVKTTHWSDTEKLGQPVEQPTPLKDLAAFERMIDALASTKKITVEAASELKTQARQFAGLKSSSDKVSFVEPMQPPPSENRWATPVGETSAWRADVHQPETQQSTQQQPTAIPTNALEVLQPSDRDFASASMPVASSIDNARPSANAHFRKLSLHSWPITTFAGVSWSRA